MQMFFSKYQTCIFIVQIFKCGEKFVFYKPSQYVASKELEFQSWFYTSCFCFLLLGESFINSFIYLFIFKIILCFLFIYFWLCWVFVSVWGLSLVAASGGHSSSRCAGLSLSWPLLLGSPGSRRAGSVVVAHGPSCSTACGIFPDQGSNPCPLHWQADSQPLRHQGSPNSFIFKAEIAVHGFSTAGDWCSQPLSCSRIPGAFVIITIT